jgi:hypothetical protein
MYTCLTAPPATTTPTPSRFRFQPMSGPRSSGLAPCSRARRSLFEGSFSPAGGWCLAGGLAPEARPSTFLAGRSSNDGRDDYARTALLVPDGSPLVQDRRVTPHAVHARALRPAGRSHHLAARVNPPPPNRPTPPAARRRTRPTLPTTRQLARRERNERTTLDLLVALEDYPVGSAAEQLKLSVSAARARLHRVRARLREQLGDQLTDTDRDDQGGMR